MVRKGWRLSEGFGMQCLLHSTVVDKGLTSVCWVCK